MAKAVDIWVDRIYLNLKPQFIPIDYAVNCDYERTLVTNRDLAIRIKKCRFS